MEWFVRRATFFVGGALLGLFGAALVPYLVTYLGLDEKVATSSCRR